MLETTRPFVWTLLVCGVCAPAGAQTAKTVSFERDVAPICPRNIYSAMAWRTPWRVSISGLAKAH